MALLMSLILGLGLAAFINSNSASAQNYGYQDEYGDTNYSTYPTDDKPYECRTGPFEGFFVSSVEFCKHVKFDKDDRKDHSRDNITGTQGPEGPQGPQGPEGPEGPAGPKGDTGATGATGSQGLKGDTGATGATGSQGLKGDAGATGATGATGAASTIPGPRGFNGSQGPIGPIGPQGPAGTVNTVRCAPNSNLPNANVTDPRLCFAATPAVQCPSGTTLAGVWVNQTALSTCNLVIPPRVQTFTCAGVAGSNLPPNANVTDQRLCTAAIPAVQCASGSDLAGVWVNSTATGIAQCNISPADITLERNPQAQCLKCADLAIFSAGTTGNAFTDSQLAARELRGNTTLTTNVFTVCANPTQATQVTAFNALVTSTTAESAFLNCLTDAAANPGTEPRAGTPAPPPVTTALQANSLTTNIQSEAEIPSFNTETQNPDLNALLEHPNLKALLEDPKLDTLLKDPSGKALLDDPNVKALLEDSEVNALLEDPEVNAQLTNPTVSPH
jgi:hypothetical protein